MKAQSLTIQKLWLLLKFFVNKQTNGKADRQTSRHGKNHITLNYRTSKIYTIRLHQRTMQIIYSGLFCYFKLFAVVQHLSVYLSVTKRTWRNDELWMRATSFGHRIIKMFSKVYNNIIWGRQTDRQTNLSARLLTLCY